MSRATYVHHSTDSSEKSAPTFGYSIKAKKEMAALRRSGLFSVPLADGQQIYLFQWLKEHVIDILRTEVKIETQDELKPKIQDEFQYKLLMATSDAHTFLCILAGWHSSAKKEYESALDYCIRNFRTLYPEIYDNVNQQSPIYKPK